MSWSDFKLRDSEYFFTEDENPNILKNTLRM